MDQIFEHARGKVGLCCCTAHHQALEEILLLGGSKQNSRRTNVRLDRMRARGLKMVEKLDDEIAHRLRSHHSRTAF